MNFPSTYAAPSLVKNRVSVKSESAESKLRYTVHHGAIREIDTQHIERSYALPLTSPRIEPWWNPELAREAGTKVSTRRSMPWGGKHRITEVHPPVHHDTGQKNEPRPYKTPI